MYEGTSLDSVNNVIADLKLNPSKDGVKYISVKCMYRAKNSFCVIFAQRKFTKSNNLLFSDTTAKWRTIYDLL